MEMHQLRYVVAVARTANFSRAAEQCRVSQPSLSQQILKLEEELGERLFDRLRRQAKLTMAGEAFLPRAVRILEEVEAARREVTEAKELLRGVVRLGVLPTIAPYLLPAVLGDFTEKFPGVEVVIHEDTSERLRQLALAYEIDFALASLPVADDRVEVRELFTERLLLALPPEHPLARRRRVAAVALEKERLIVMKAGHCLGDQVLRFCDQGQLRPRISFRSAQLETIQSLVRAGLGLSLVPEMAIQPAGGGAPVYRPIEAPQPTRTIVAFWPRARPPGRATDEILGIVAARSGRSRR